MSRPEKQRRSASDSQSPKPKSGGAEEGPGQAARRHSLGAWAREWADAIIIAYVLAMFIRAFAVELYKIPSGSMTPTLIGDPVAEIDYNADGVRDLLVYKGGGAYGGLFQVFTRQGKEWLYQGKKEIGGTQFDLIRPFIKQRFDRILVNKCAFWFSRPQRGDLIVFKVPDRIWSPEKPIYIKRAVAFEGEEARFVTPPGEDSPDGKGRLAINGRIVEDPPVFQKLRYGALIDQPLRNGPPENTYLLTANGFQRRFDRCVVPKGRLLALGDNTDYSSDGRYWGTVPLENLKGKAFLRYWPLRKTGFLH